MGIFPLPSLDWPGPAWRGAVGSADGGCTRSKGASPRSVPTRGAVHLALEHHVGDDRPPLDPLPCGCLPKAPCILRLSTMSVTMEFIGVAPMPPATSTTCSN
eukprot:2530437-Pyramimonas_sp.AAC.1